MHKETGLQPVSIDKQLQNMDIAKYGRRKKLYCEGMI